MEKRGTMEWHWMGELSTLKNINGFHENLSAWEESVEWNFTFSQEVERWIKEGILVSWKWAANKGALLLIAVVQLTKNNVRHALDLRGLGDCVKCNTGGDIIDIYTETLKKWGQRIGVTTLVNLKNTCLQLYMNREL